MIAAFLEINYSKNAFMISLLIINYMTTVLLIVVK